MVLRTAINSLPATARSRSALAGPFVILSVFGIERSFSGERCGRCMVPFVDFSTRSRIPYTLKRYNQYSFLALPLTTATRANRWRVPIGEVVGKAAPAALPEDRPRRCRPPLAHKENGQPHGFRLAVSFISPACAGRAKRANCTVGVPPSR